MSEARTSTVTLAEAWRVFFRFTAPRVLTPLIIGAWALRVWWGNFNLWDLGIVLLVLACQPVVEWATHIFVLHMRPRLAFGRIFDPLVARKHRAHHADPRNPGLVFIPTVVFLQMVVIGPVLCYLAIPDHELSLTAVAATYTMLGGYEWTHYLIHTPYRPRRSYFAYVRRAHLNHHFNNENYWFGITMHLADHLLGTFPDTSAVETSPTARTLGVS